ncbi:MAG: DUF6553 family protein [Oscillospiraceae bacterium]|jgi:hypothetical protein
MYEIDPVLRAYYEEIEPDRRKSIFETLDPSGDPAYEYRKALLEARYEFPEKRGGIPKDNFLWICLSALDKYRDSRLVRRTVKEMTSIWEKYGLDKAGDYGTAGKAALYWELRNTVRRYISTCSDGSYGRMLFGLVKATDEHRNARIAEDIYQMGRGFAQKYGLEDMMRVYLDAVDDEYCSEFPDGAERLDRLGGR